MYTSYTPMKSVQEDTVVVPLRMSSLLAQRLERAAKRIGYGSRSELMREALEVRVKEIMASKVLEVEEMSADEAARRIDRYLSKHPGVHFVSDLAEELGLELSIAFKAVNKMKEQALIKVREQ